MVRVRKFVVLLAVVSVSVVMTMSGALWAEEAKTEDVKKVNINTATVEELVQLNKIGQKYAERIVAYREQNGPFKKPEDIMQVKGVGEKTWEKNKDSITTE
jgi:competence protein ComEA